MIFPVAGLIFGAVLGAARALARGGNARDMLQWAAVFAMIFGVIGMFVLVFIERSYT